MKDGDHEKAYICFYNFFRLVTNLRKKDEYLKDKDFFDRLMGPNKVRDSIENIEHLQKSLEKR